MKKEVVGTLLAFGTAIISGFAIFANKFFIIGLDPTVFTAIRAVIIGVVFLILSLVFGSWKKGGNKREEKGKVGKKRREIDVKRDGKTNWWYLVLIGLFGGGLAFLLFFNGLKLTTGGRAAFFHKTLPLYVLVMAFFFLKEKISKKQLWALLIMFAGTIVMVSAKISPGEMWLNPLRGDLLVIFATILWAVENVISKKAMIKGEHNFVVSFARMFFGAILLFGVVLLSGKINLIAELSGTQWFYILLSTTILFGYILTFYWAIRYINVSKAASILLLSPVITLVLGAIFLGEPTPVLQLVGGGVILIGAYLVAGVKSEVDNGR